MFEILMIAVFMLGYIAIGFEQPLKLNKAASALITGVMCWTIYIFHSSSGEAVTKELFRFLGEISSILFFLLGAMVIVELIDSHGGFKIITRNIRTQSKPKLLWIVVAIAFFLSALLDNLTTTIVMVTLSARLLDKRADKLWFSAMIIISANAGGVWSPLGDVTTTMLWIGGQITPLNAMKHLIMPSAIAGLVPLMITSFRFRGQKFVKPREEEVSSTEKLRGKVVLVAGIGFLVFVPVFKTVTHLPPFMGMMLALGLMWIITTIIHLHKAPDQIDRYTVTSALQKIDTPSILFFLGILLAVAALESAGILKHLASNLTQHLHNDYVIGGALGLLSAVVDNVPLVAASQGMFDQTTYPTDHHFWQFLALTTGTGGSAIIIGSAAGVAAMGLEKINFIWYLKNISWMALLGFGAGILSFLLQRVLTG